MSWFTRSAKRSTRPARQQASVAGGTAVASRTNACPSCGLAVGRAGVPFGGKRLNGVRCKGCGRSFCLVCYNPAERLLTCEECGHGEFSFLVDGA